MLPESREYDGIGSMSLGINHMPLSSGSQLAPHELASFLASTVALKLSLVLTVIWEGPCFNDLY